MESKPLATFEQRIILEITFLYVVLTIAVIIVTTMKLFNQLSFDVAWVPIWVLEWGFLGGMVAVIYRLSYQRKRFVNLPQLGTWVIAKPLIGIVMGALVYLLAVSGQLYLNSGVQGASGTISNNPQLFCAIAFIAAFSDRWSIDLIEQFTRKTGLAEDDQAVTPEPVKEGQEQAKEGGEPAVKTPPVK
jgi:hypothetical protein